jgi:hypothetical protein
MLLCLAIMGTSIEIRTANSFGRIAVRALFCARHFCVFGGLVWSSSCSSRIENLAGGVYGDDECIAGVCSLLPYYFLPRQPRESWAVQTDSENDLGEVRVLLSILAGDGRADC